MKKDFIICMNLTMNVIEESLNYIDKQERLHHKLLKLEKITFF